MALSISACGDSSAPSSGSNGSSSGGSGGGSSGGNGGGSGGSGTVIPVSYSVVGPLDPLQAAVSDNIFENLGSNLPPELNSVTSCVDVLATQNTLDVVDGIVNALSTAQANPTSAYQAALLNTNTGLQAVIANLINTINVASGSGNGCVAGSFTPNQNAIASIAALQALSDLLKNDAADPNLTSIAYVLNQVVSVLDGVVGQTPAEARAVPVLGGLIITLEHLSDNIQPAFSNILNYSATAGNADLEKLIAVALNDVLTGVIPTGTISPDLAAQFGLLSLTLAQTLGGITGPLLDLVSLLAGSGLASILNPVELLLLTLLVNPGLPLP